MYNIFICKFDFIFEYKLYLKMNLPSYTKECRSILSEFY